MAFKPDKNIAKALKQSNDIKNNSTENKKNISKIDYSEMINFVSKKKTIKVAMSITLDSDVKKGIQKLAELNGYASVSAYINDYFKKLIELAEK